MVACPAAGLKVPATVVPACPNALAAAAVSSDKTCVPSSKASELGARSDDNGNAPRQNASGLGASLERGAGRFRSEGGAASAHALGLSKVHNSLRAHLEAYRGASHLAVRIEHRTIANRTPSRRGMVESFTPASRRRFMNLLTKVRSDSIPLLVTLTYPDEFPLYHQDYKRHLDLLGRRLLRHCPGASIIWKLEFKERRSGQNKGKIAPHYHLFIFNVLPSFAFKVAKGRFYTVTKRTIYDGTTYFLEDVRDHQGGVIASGLLTGQSFSSTDDEEVKREFALHSFRSWVSGTWYDIVGTGDARHFRAGTRVEEIRSTRGVFAYASKKYAGKPVDCSNLENKPGRFWGVLGRPNLPLGTRKVVSLSQSEAFHMMRLLRRHRLANTPPKKRRYCRFNTHAMKAYVSADYWLERIDRLLEQKQLPSSFLTVLGPGRVARRSHSPHQADGVARINRGSDCR